MKRWLSSSGRVIPFANRTLEKQLAEIEIQLDNTSLAFRSRPLNRAGDLCAKAGDSARAIGYYGRALDSLLHDGDLKASRGVAQKITRVHPEAVRILCTLTWLDLAASHMTAARLHLEAYAKAARGVNQDELAASQILLMARWAPDGPLLAVAAEALDELGEADRATQVRLWSLSGGSPEAITDPRELRSHCLRAAAMSNTKPEIEPREKVKSAGS